MLGAAPLSTYPISSLPLPAIPAAPIVFPAVGAAPTWLSKTIPSYLYAEYQNDDDCQSFVDAYNQLTQKFVDWFTSIDLPIYTGSQISGGLLDWVAQGIYGQSRPTLSSGQTSAVGPFNTWNLNTIDFNGRRVTRAGPVYATTDDVFKRIITWNFFKGDGRVFSVEWLKRRVIRFLTGDSGTAPPIGQTYQVSVTFAVGNRVIIDIVDGVRRTTGGSLFNRFGLNTTPFNTVTSEFVQFAALLNAAVLAQAVASGAVELPFQFSFIVQVAGQPTGLLFDSGGVLGVMSGAGWPSSASGLLAGDLYSNFGLACIVPPTTPSVAPPVYFPGVSASALLALGGTNLPNAPGPAGSGQLWNDGYVVAIS